MHNIGIVIIILCGKRNKFIQFNGLEIRADNNALVMQKYLIFEIRQLNEHKALLPSVLSQWYLEAVFFF